MSATAFVIAVDSEEARSVVDEVIGKADPKAVNAFGHDVENAGKSSPEGEGNWAKWTFSDLVRYDDGFWPNLIGRPQQIAERIVALKDAGADLMLCAFLRFQEEIEYFGQTIPERGGYAAAAD